MHDNHFGERGSSGAVPGVNVSPSAWDRIHSVSTCSWLTSCSYGIPSHRCQPLSRPLSGTRGATRKAFFKTFPAVTTADILRRGRRRISARTQGRITGRQRRPGSLVGVRVRDTAATLSLYSHRILTGPSGGVNDEFRMSNGEEACRLVGYSLFADAVRLEEPNNRFEPLLAHCLDGKTVSPYHRQAAAVHGKTLSGRVLDAVGAVQPVLRRNAGEHPWTLPSLKYGPV